MDVSSQQNPQKKLIGSTPIIDKLKAASDSMNKATKYPTGVFQLNGMILLINKNKIEEKFVTTFNFTFNYHTF